MSLGIFDTIGPIMHGPSSNHTGGMVKIAAMAREIMGGCPDSFVLEMSPALFNIHLGQRTHVAVMAGMLGMRESDLNCTSSLDMAADAGIGLEVVPCDDIQNRNVIRIRGSLDGLDWSVEGDSVGAGSIVITAINGIQCSLDGNTHVCVLRGQKDLVTKAVETASEFVLPEVYEGTAPDGSYLAILQMQSPFGFSKDCDCEICRGHHCNHEHEHEHHECNHEHEHHECSHNHEHEHLHISNYKTLKTDVLGPYVFRKDLSISIAPALTKFYPKGDYPLNGELSFEKLVWLCEKKNSELKVVTGEESAEKFTSLSEVLIDYECARDGVSREEVIEQCGKTFDIMMDTLERGKNGAIHLIGGITDPDDGQYMLTRAKEGKSIVSEEFSELLGNALISSGMNASGERIVATPTGGSSGVLPACLSVYSKKFGSSRAECLDACFAAAAVGMVYGEHLNFTGTGAGCQSEIGVSAAMAAAAVVSLAGGGVEAMFHASAIAAKNLLGLTCDIPIGPVEVPCIKRNAIASAIAVAAAEMALAGVKSAISPDGVAVAMADTAECMPSCLRCNQEHGLASTETATEIKAYWADRLKSLK